MRAKSSKQRRPALCKVPSGRFFFHCHESSYLVFHSRLQGMVWNGMKRKFRYRKWKMPEWNGMENFKNGIRNNLPFFYINFIIGFAYGANRKIYTDSDNKNMRKL